MGDSFPTKPRRIVQVTDGENVAPLGSQSNPIYTNGSGGGGAVDQGNAGAQPWVVDGSGVTQPVSAASLPLPAGAAAEATLALIKAKTDNLDVALSTRAVTGLTDAQLRAAAIPISTGKTIKSAVVSVSSQGDNTVVAAVGGKRIKVIGFTLQAIGSVAVKWKDGASDLTGAFSFQTREGLSIAMPASTFAFATSVGAALVLNLSSAVSIVGFVTYWDDDSA